MSFGQRPLSRWRLSDSELTRCCDHGRATYQNFLPRWDQRVPPPKESRSAMCDFSHFWYFFVLELSVVMHDHSLQVCTYMMKWFFNFCWTKMTSRPSDVERKIPRCWVYVNGWPVMPWPWVPSTVASKVSGVMRMPSIHVLRMPPSCPKRFIFLTMSSPQGPWRCDSCATMSIASMKKSEDTRIFQVKFSVDFDETWVWNCDGSGRPWLLFWKHGTQEAFLNAWCSRPVILWKIISLTNIFWDGLKLNWTTRFSKSIGHLSPRQVFYHWSFCNQGEEYATQAILSILASHRGSIFPRWKKGKPKNGRLAKDRSATWQFQLRLRQHKFIQIQVLQVTYTLKQRIKRVSVLA